MKRVLSSLLCLILLSSEVWALNVVPSFEEKEAYYSASEGLYVYPSWVEAIPYHDFSGNSYGNSYSDAIDGVPVAKISYEGKYYLPIGNYADGQVHTIYTSSIGMTERFRFGASGPVNTTEMSLLYSFSGKTAIVTGTSNRFYQGSVVIPSKITQEVTSQWEVQSGTWNTSSNDQALGGVQYTCVSPGTNGSTVLRCYFKTTGTVTFSVVSNGESNYDYLTIGELDQLCTRSNYKTTLNGLRGTVKHLSYTLGDTEIHFVEFCYSKDGSQDTSPDNATVYIVANESQVEQMGTHYVEYDVTSIGAGAFSGCAGITSLVVPASITSIGNNAFNGCTSLSEVVFENGETSLSMGYNSNNSRGLFKDCPLERVFMGRNMTFNSSSYTPFRDHSTLSNVTFSHTCTQINSSMFYNCDAIESISIPLTITTIGSSAFYDCSSLKSVTIEDADTQLSISGSSSFYSCPLEQAYLGRNLYYSSSEYSPFRDKKALTSVTISENVTTLPYYIFYGCSALEAVTIPATVTSIGSYAFYNCSKLGFVCELNPDPSKISVNSNSFSYYNILAVPTGSVDLYKQYTVWKKFNILEGSPTPDGMMCYSITGENTVKLTYINNNRLKLVIPDKLSIDNRTYSVTEIGSNVSPVSKSILESLVIPSTVQRLEAGAFTNFSTLHKVIIYGNSVPSGINEAFSALTDRVTYVSSDKYQEYASVLGRIVVEPQLSSSFESGGVTYVPQISARTCYAIDYDYETADVEVKNLAEYRGVLFTVNKIAENAFRGNKTLESIVVGGNLVEIEKNALSNCSALKTVNITDGSNPLKMSTPFSGPIETLVLSREINYASSILSGQEKLNTLSITGHASTARAVDFKDKYRNTLQTLTLGNNVISIEDGVFSNCTGIDSPIELGNRIQSIGKNAFYNCSNIPSVNIVGNGTTVIDESAFEKCAKLDTLRLGEGFQILGKNAFKNCFGLKAAYIRGNGNTMIGESAFESCTSLENIHLADSI